MIKLKMSKNLDVIGTSRGIDEDIQYRKKQNNLCYRKTSLQRSQKNTKTRIFNSNVKSILLYGSDTWRLTDASTKSLQVFRNSCLRNIIGKKKIWKRTRQEPIQRTITTRRWKLIGNTLRKTNTNVTRQALDLTLKGYRDPPLPLPPPKKKHKHLLFTENWKTWEEAKKIAKKRWKATLVALYPL